ncbi:gluconolactonase [Bordetella ansorpii]|uniref:Gluconolactonase n=1 Tax=Bordetella ansorpii TaxID=288768 RepID=A0A157Q997_9BORD|nr:SMP-30/gluconolactonase/LRE family protein [Bordetella ansorpii]SAI42126.1 gluconolactonase [Bordetella ansorpii]
MFAPPPVIATQVFTSMPDAFRKKGVRSAWTDANKHGQTVHSFLEGPTFDRQGNLYVTDIPFGRIFRITPAGQWELIIEYDGEPNGLAMHADGRLFVADYRNGILQLDVARGRVEPVVQRARSEHFRGCNDLTFDMQGNLYFTDQGQTGLHDATGRVYRLNANGRLECLLSNVPSPNGLVLNREQSILYLAVTRANAVWRVPLMLDGGVSKVGVFLQLSGSLGGPDGLAMDVDDNLVVAHSGLTVWQFSRLGEPIARIEPSTGPFATNVAFGVDQPNRLFITESSSGSVLCADLPQAGRSLYSHSGPQAVSKEAS